MDTLNLLAGGGTNPLQSVANAFDRWAKGTSSPQAPAPVPAPPQASTSQAGSNIPVPSTVEVRSPEDWAEQFDTFSGDLDLFLTMISAVGFLIAVLSILNTMLMSVMERIGEFGILRAMGWTRREVMQLVMSESAVIGLVGGIVGVVLGTAASAVANQVWPDRLLAACVAGVGTVCVSDEYAAGRGWRAIPGLESREALPDGRHPPGMRCVGDVAPRLAFRADSPRESATSQIPTRGTTGVSSVDSRVLAGSCLTLHDCGVKLYFSPP